VARPWYERDRGGGPCDHATVPSDFLPPDPYAEAPTPKRERNPAVLALAAGAAALGLLALTTGALFFVTVPASIVAWVLGQRAKRMQGGSDQGNVAVIMGIVGTILGVAAGVVWIVIWT
jgi:hypothetical protein